MKLATLVFALLLVTGIRVHAAEITLFSTNAFKTVLDDLVPQFERSSGHKLTIRFGPTSELKAQIEKGETFDLAILTAAATDDLIKQGKLAAATRTDVARSGVGVAIRKGATKPDLSSVEAFKRALLQTSSITYTGAGFTGPNLRKLFERLGIADEMKAKTRIATGNAAEAVSRGEAELGFTQASEILHVAGAELAGPLPPEVQIYTVFTAASATGAGDTAAGRAFVGFLTAPAAASVIRTKGMETARPGGH
jgi:molybdate transport system substrate-binding protein